MINITILITNFLRCIEVKKKKFSKYGITKVPILYILK